ncbi:7817_t:CDS:2 [Dentiscutata erythropus]|uniref:7817_t:CDS:1 n=1 Tax=Dentiscutata erythropus TaxID=1348616 RepID=A0A9N9JH60_9GLOM|nr:7817_t:CDS:2 [Dentiscutata erythropus]
MQSNDFIENDAFKVILNDREDWKWPCFDEYRSRNGLERRVRIESINIDPFVVVYPRDGYPYVELSSQKLIKILRDILPSNKILVNNDNQNESVTDLESNIHLKRLIRFLEHEYKKTIKNREKMITNKIVSYDMLWVFYTENLDVWYRCNISGQQVGGVIVSAQDNGISFLIKIKVIEYDGVGYKFCHINREIDYFKGEVSFSDLPVVPSELSTAQDFLKENIIANGKQFFRLASGHHLMNYEGPLLRERYMRIEKVKSDGRVMIDLQSFATMNPEYQMGFAKPPNKCDVKMLKEKNTYIQTNDLHKDSNYFLAPAVVYGFGFSVKEWGLFEVSKFSDVIFDTDALDQVVMPQNKKNMLEGLVSQYGNPIRKTNGDATNPFEKSLDPITNKGNGCIFLCYGPPGTGKTLTAQSVAEHLRMPLWVLTVRELGSTPETLEAELVKVLDIAYTWNAVLLLDEADIYLERRSTIDLTRNTMVGIFLRLLEYYQVNMFFHYPKLGPTERLQIWTNFIERASLPLKASDFVNYELNGREIRNVLHAARLLAKNKGENLSADIVFDVIKIIQEFRQVTDGMDCD